MKLKRPTKFIKILELENFQSHKYLKLELDEGFNVITGTNNAGKTAIWRAIDFIFNFGKKGHGSFDPSYVSHKAAFCKIIIHFFDGTKLVRIKSGHKGDKNSIHIYNEKNELIYEKLKADKAYDQFVTDFLGDPSYDEELGSLAFIDQSQAPFLISLTSTKIPEAFARLIKSADYDNAVKILKSENNSYSSTIKSTDTEITKLELELDNYSDLDDQIKVIEDNDKLVEINDGLEITTSVLSNLREDAINHKYRIKNLKLENDGDKKFLNELENLDDFETIKTAIDNLSKIYNVIESNEEKIITLELENDKDGYLISDAFVTVWDELRKTYQLIKSLDVLNTDLIDKNEEVDSLIKLQESDENTISQIEIEIKQYQDQNIELSKKLEFCNECGQRLDNA
jgi:DNA repair ATPase RecN